MRPRIQALQRHLAEADTSAHNTGQIVTAITDALTRTGYSLPLVRDRSDLLKQLAGQIIFSCGSLEQFWSLFMDPDNARRTACTLAGARLGYYALVAVKGEHHG